MCPSSGRPRAGYWGIWTDSKREREKAGFERGIGERNGEKRGEIGMRREGLGGAGYCIKGQETLKIREKKGRLVE